MWIDKLSVGVLRVLTPVGPRYIQPELTQRVYLLWIFRHFKLLPLQVLSARQQRLVDELCAKHRFVSLPNDLDDAPIPGTVEWRPRIDAEVLPPSRPSARVASVASAAAGSRQAS